jgi:hypothetical protein
LNFDRALKQREEGRGKKEEGRRKKEEGRRIFFTNQQEDKREKSFPT